MPDTWNSADYRARALKWRAEAEALPPGEERDACLVLADGYANLASLIEADNPGCLGKIKDI